MTTGRVSAYHVTPVILLLCKEEIVMSTITETRVLHLSHDMVCCYCEHARHTYLPCSDTCDCVPPPVPGIYAEEPERTRCVAAVDTAAVDTAA